MPSWLPIHWNGSNRTCNAMCKGKSKQNTNKKSQSCFVKDGNIGTTPTNNVQGQLQLKWACLIKHLADEDIPKMQGSVPNQSLIPICVYFWIGLTYHFEKAIQMCKAKPEVVEPVGYHTSKKPRKRCNAKYQPNPPAASFVWGGGQYQL